MTQRTLLNPNPQSAPGSAMGHRLGRFFTYFVLLSWSLFTMFAILWISLASLKTSREIFREPFKLPAEPQWHNYETAWNTIRLGDYFINSVIIVGCSLVLLMAVSAPAAYVLSRFRFRGGGMPMPDRRGRVRHPEPSGETPRKPSGSQPAAGAGGKKKAKKKKRKRRNWAAEGEISAQTRRPNNLH